MTRFTLGALIGIIGVCIWRAPLPSLIGLLAAIGILIWNGKEKHGNILNERKRK